MDPSIMKLLEEDEDETLHSGADVEAFTAALNRDMKGDPSGISQLSESDRGQLFAQWQASSNDENASCQSQQVVSVPQQQEQHSSVKALDQGSENQLQQVDSAKESNCTPVQQKPSEDNFLQQQTEHSNSHVLQSLSTPNLERSDAVGQEPDTTKDSSSISQHLQSQKINSQQGAARTQANNSVKNGKQVPFAMLFPVIEPLLDKDRAMQLRTIYNRLRKNEISKDGFVKHLKDLVGDHMLKLAVVKLQEQAPRISQVATNPVASQSPTVGAKQFSESHSLAQPNQTGINTSASPSDPSSVTQPLTVPSNLAMDRNVHMLREIKQEMVHPSQIQGLNKQQKQHMHLPPSSIPSYGTTGSNHQQYAGGNMNSSAQSLNQQPHNLQVRQVSVHLGAGTMQSMGVPNKEKQNAVAEPMRMQGGNLSHSANHSKLHQNLAHSQLSVKEEQSHSALVSGRYVKQEPINQTNEQQRTSQLSSSQGVSSFSPVQFEQANASRNLSDVSIAMQQSRTGFSTSSDIMQSNTSLSHITTQLDSSTLVVSRLSSATPSVGPGSITKIPMKKPIIGLKKPTESLTPEASQPMQKKQKIFHSDQSIEQLNDVTAVSGVNLREEEEQLFSGPKEDSRVSEASRRIVQEEEERLILHKIPLQKNLAEITRKCGLKSISNDVERCLSLSVEERLRALIYKLIRLSKQRVDIEKSRHRTIVTSDVRQQIITMNHKAREEWDIKQSDTEKNQGVNEPEGNNGTEGDKERDDTRARPIRANKEDDDKMRTTAANVAARAAVGGDDMLSKWQLMAEQARQKHGGVDSASSSQPGGEVNRKLVSSSVKNAKDNQDSEKKSPSATGVTSGVMTRSGKNRAISQTGVPRSICVKDVLAALEREPQTSKSTLIYRLYEKMREAGR